MKNKMTIEADTKIKYTVEDDGTISSFILSFEEIENEKLYSILHDNEKYTCLAKIIKREIVNNAKEL